MKKILVPTDFSPWAQMAGDLATTLAPQLNARVDFLHRLYLPPLWEGYSAKEKEQFPFSHNQYDQMQDRFRRLQQRYEEKGVRMTTSYASGDLVPAISRYVEEENVYMIVMGSHGTTELSAKILGSNAQKVIRHAHCPVLVVKREAPSQPFENILFASDFSKEAEGPYKWLMEFANRMGAHLHLLYITPYGSKGIPEKTKARMQAFADIYPLKASIHTEKDFELGIGIAHAAEQIKADLISLAHPERSALLRFLTGSVAEELANQLETPVLSLNMPNSVSLEELEKMNEVRRVFSSDDKLAVN